MAEDNNARYRSGNPLGRSSAQANHTNDPLAELARLIGRNDPFSELERASAATPPVGELGDPVPQFGGDPLPRYHRDPPLHHGPDEPLRIEDDQPPRLDWPGSLDAGQSASYYDPSDRSNRDTPAYPPALERPAFLQALYPEQPEVGSMPAPYDDEVYDEVPTANRRKGLLTVAAVLALAVMGTAGAFGYRSMFGGASSSAPPPVIRASSEPSKVEPLTQPVDQTASKFSYDRFGDRGQNEQVVVREEKPVDNRELGRTTMPRTTLPGAPTASVQGQAAAQQASPNPPSALGEPRRVRTVPIRPDQPDSASRPQQSAGRQQAAPMQIAPMPPPPQARQPTTVAEPPADVDSPPLSARAASPRSNQRVAARSGSPSGAGENVPLSLSPNSNNGSSSAMAPREPEPARAAVPPVPARVPAAPSGNGGGYLVQVASQKSEADAQSSFRSIQSKYSNVLSGQRHVIRRADLGSRGVYYRAMVGPFGSREQALQLCSSLKTAGGDCIVQAN